jgi:hypothetical protein
LLLKYTELYSRVNLCFPDHHSGIRCPGPAGVFLLTPAGFDCRGTCQRSTGGVDRRCLLAPRIHEPAESDGNSDRGFIFVSDHQRPPHHRPGSRSERSASRRFTNPEIPSVGDFTR